MAQKPVIPQSRKTVERAKKPAAKDTVKKLDKAVGARGSTLGTIDTLVNKHLASFRNAEKTLAEYTSARMPRMNRKVTQVPHPHQVGRAAV